MLYRLDEVGLSFAGRTVLRGLSLQHNPGEKLVLLGRNGCGKTTLVRLITGELAPDTGRVTRASGLQLASLEQIPTASGHRQVLEYCLDAFGPLLEIEEEIEVHERVGGPAARLHELHEELERLDGFRARPRAEAALQSVGIPPSLFSRRLAELSGGQRTRVGLVRALLSPGVLLLDEPTNHLDLLGVEYLASEVAAPGRAVLVVTHDRDLVDRVGGPVLELAAGRVERYPSGWDAYRRERAGRRAQLRRAWELQQAEIRRQEEFIRRNMAGQNTRQAQARQNLLDRMERLEAPPADPATLKVRWPESVRSGDRVLEAQRLSVGWGGNAVIAGASFAVGRGERWAVVGRNGSGKSTLVRTLAGAIPPLAGGYRFGTGVVPGWYDQEQSEIAGGGTPLDILAAARPDWTPAEARAWAGRFSFSGEAAEVDAKSLSGGERARLALAVLLATAPNLVLLDEPTNHLDADTCEALEDALRTFPGGLLLVSHDRRLVERVCQGAILLENGLCTVLDRVETAFARIGLPAARSRGRSQTVAAPRRSIAEEERRRLRRDAARARERADGAGSDLEASERRLREIEALLCEREVFSEPERARALASEGDELRQAIESLFAEWTELEEDAAALEARLEELERG